MQEACEVLRLWNCINGMVEQGRRRCISLSQQGASSETSTSSRQERSRQAAGSSVASSLLQNVSSGSPFSTVSVGLHEGRQQAEAHQSCPASTPQGGGCRQPGRRKSSSPPSKEAQWRASPSQRRATQQARSRKARVEDVVQVGKEQTGSVKMWQPLSLSPAIPQRPQCL